MRRYIIIALLFSISVVTFGQISSKRFLVGGNGNFYFEKTDDNTIYFRIEPSFGVVFLNRNIFGISPLYKIKKIKSPDSTTDTYKEAGFSLFYEYYFLEGKFSPYLNINQTTTIVKKDIEYLYNTTVASYTNNYTDIGGGIALGLVYFVNDCIALDSKLGYHFSIYKNELKMGGGITETNYNIKRIELLFGIKIFI